VYRRDRLRLDVLGQFERGPPPRVLRSLGADEREKNMYPRVTTVRTSIASGTRR
jgi:hypothetical protein